MVDTVRLGDLSSSGWLAINDGYRTKKAELAMRGVPILRAAEVQDGYITPTFSDYVSEDYRRQFANKTSQAGDVIVTTKGTVGRVARIGISDPQFVYSPQLCFFRVLDETQIDSGFLYQWFRGIEFRRQALTVQSQTDMAPYINLADMRSLRITLPPLPGQRAIADMLGALDDKVEANQRTANIIDALVQNLFTSTCQPGDDFERLLDIAVVQKGVSYRSTDLAPSTTALVTLKSFNRNGGYKADGLKPYKGDFKPPQEVFTGELAVALTDLTQGAEVVGRVIRIPPVRNLDHLIASLDLAILRPREGFTAEYLYGVLQSVEFREHCRSRTAGTTVLHLGSDALSSFRFPRVTREERARFSEVSRPFFAMQDSISLETTSIVELRDTLLPALFSGRMQTVAVTEHQGTS